MASIPNNLNDILKHSPKDRLQLAHEAVKKSGLKPNGDPIYSARSASLDFNISRSTLGNRLKGIQSVLIYEQLFSPIHQVDSLGM
jgi:hypothetical protein